MFDPVLREKARASMPQSIYLLEVGDEVMYPNWRDDERAVITEVIYHPEAYGAGSSGYFYKLLCKENEKEGVSKKFGTATPTIRAEEARLTPGKELELSLKAI